jgi:hypothetical protein
MPTAHLLPQVEPLLDASNEDRIRFIKRDRWIGYPRAREILDMMDDLLMYPKRHRMPNLLLIGDTNNGKTMLLRKFLDLHPPDMNLDGDAAKIPVLLVQCPPIPDEARLYRVILDTLCVPYRSRDRVDNLQYQVIAVMKRVGVTVLILDEIQHVLAGNQTKQRPFLNVLKYLSNELMIPIIAAGIQDALMVLNADPQLSNRFKIAGLPRWKLDTQFFRLLTSFEKVLPLRSPSNLNKNDIPIKLLSMTEGLIGELSALLSIAAIMAIKSKTEQINMDLLNSIDWVAPSERKRTAEQLR